MIKFSVKMAVKNKSLIILTLVLATVLAGTPSNAVALKESSMLQVPRRQLKPHIMEQVTDQLQQRLEKLDEEGIEERLNQALGASELEDSESDAAPLWVAVARGKSWTILPVEPQPDFMRVGVVFAATKIKTTAHGSVYDVVWGILGHDGERVGVRGKGLLCGEGVFLIHLEGEDLELYGIGLLGRAWYGVRIAMKGYMEQGDVKYGFRMAGGAHPIGLNWKPPQFKE